MRHCLPFALGPMSRHLERAKARYVGAHHEAARLAATEYAKEVQGDLTLRLWSRSVELAYKEQWEGSERHPDGGWDWPAVAQIYREPHDKIVGLFCDDMLCAMIHVNMPGNVVRLQLLEGRPIAGCPLKRVRAAIALEYAAYYGQSQGRVELRCRPVNDRVSELYKELFGFSTVTEGGEAWLYRRLK